MTEYLFRLKYNKHFQDWQPITAQNQDFLEWDIFDSIYAKQRYNSRVNDTIYIITKGERKIKILVCI